MTDELTMPAVIDANPQRKDDNMEIIIKNSKTPQFATHEPFADFHLVLRRDGDKIVLHVPSPRCFRNWHNFTPAEKDAYNAIVQHVIDTAPAAMKKARRTM